MYVCVCAYVCVCVCARVRVCVCVCVCVFKNVSYFPNDTFLHCTGVLSNVVSTLGGKSPLTAGLCQTIVLFLSPKKPPK